MKKSSPREPADQRHRPSASNDGNSAIAEFADNRSTTMQQMSLAARIERSPLMTIQRTQLNVDHSQDGEISQHKTNTGLPDNLKAGIESLSGIDMSDVQVHKNSARPAQLNALAYAQGSNIHLAPGQEQHLPHEAWHVVQQRQGRVAPTLQAKGTFINDDSRLEQEADQMGAKAHQQGARMLQAKSIDVMKIADTTTAAIQLKDDIGLGFSDLGNQTYKQDDVFGNRNDAKGNLASFREAVGAKGPGAFTKGVSSQRVQGGIQPIFTQGIKQAMAKSLTIKQNLAGFTTAQIDHARNHAPILTAEEEAASKQYTPMYKDYGPETAELWDSMKHVGDARKWGPDISAISVWELSHMLHNEELFDKTQFYHYDSSEDHPVTTPISSSNLATYGIELNEFDLKSLEELGIQASKSDKKGNWFTRLFCCCC